MRTARAERRATSSSQAAWTCQLAPREWQIGALSEWTKAGRRGVVEAATGSGKTAIALLAIYQLHRELGDRLRVAVVVPTKVLAHQWRAELERKLGIPGAQIGEHHSDARIEWQPRHPVLIAVVNSARTSLAPVLQGWKKRECTAFLIVDECHRAGSEYNARIFDGAFDCSLGLSATPERDDRGHDEFVYPNLGPPVYRYPLLNALNDGVLAPVRSINLYVDFASEEQAQWAELSADIADAFRNLLYRYPTLQTVPDELLFREVSKLAKQEEPLARKIQKLVADRCELLSTAQSRLACQRAILEWLAQGGQRALVFHEKIAAAELTHDYLVRQLRVRAGLDHSERKRADREAAMDAFRRQRHQVLVAVKALDEGIDVPDASVAVIAAGSRSRRQRIQRFGRVLRKAEGKEALVVSILVRNTPEEAAVGGRDTALLGDHRVRHHRWPGTPVVAAVGPGPSTYRPDAPEYSLEDLLTLTELGLWEPGMSVVTRDVGRTPSGGYGSRQSTFSPNAWYPVDEVRAGIGVPSREFDRLRRDVRRMYRLRLDRQKANDFSLIHGSEIEAVRSQWRRLERNRKNVGRR